MIQATITPFKPQKNKILLLNQLKLPHKKEWVPCSDHKEVASAINKMIVRGAPAIGISAAYGFYLGVRSLDKNLRLTDILTEVTKIKKVLDQSRPTAVNLMWSTDEYGRDGLCIVGADRVVKNGDVANKIGTYSLSVLAKHHNVPFFVIAPRSTYDVVTQQGSDIPIENRASRR